MVIYTISNLVVTYHVDINNYLTSDFYWKQLKF